MTEVVTAIITWINSFDELDDIHNINDIADGQLLGKLLISIDQQHFQQLGSLPDTRDNWILGASNVKKVSV